MWRRHYQQQPQQQQQQQQGGMGGINMPLALDEMGNPIPPEEAAALMAEDGSDPAAMGMMQ